VNHPWNDSDNGKLNYLVKTCQCRFVHHKSHKDRSGIEPGLPRLGIGNYPREKRQAYSTGSSILKTCTTFRANYCLHPPNYTSHHSRTDLPVKDVLFRTNWTQTKMLRISSKNHVFLQKRKVNSLRLPNKFVE
jgi:hypothetical protein